jgi:hypothetical protein
MTSFPALQFVPAQNETQGSVPATHELKYCTYAGLLTFEAFQSWATSRSTSPVINHFVINQRFSISHMLYQSFSQASRSQQLLLDSHLILEARAKKLIQTLENGGSNEPQSKVTRNRHSEQQP